jgi:catechol 2,3-dioxygenase-like lactoylglutathione lyase family enzyme
MKLEERTKRDDMSPPMEEHESMPDIILGVQHVGLTVSNVDEALRWFREALGFKEIFREDPIDIDDEHWAQALGVPLGSKMEASVLIGCGAGIELELFQYSSDRGAKPPADTRISRTGAHVFGWNSMASQMQSESE